jgi:hypothetical protein
MMRKKQPVNEMDDFFSLVAGFLNLKIKLYHAVIASIVIGAVILYATREHKSSREE